MTENRVVALRQKGAIDDPLTEILRTGARRLINGYFDWSLKQVRTGGTKEDGITLKPSCRALDILAADGSFSPDPNVVDLCRRAPADLRVIRWAK